MRSAEDVVRFEGASKRYGSLLALHPLDLGARSLGRSDLSGG